MFNDQLLPRPINNIIFMFLSHPVADLIKQEMKDIDILLNPLLNILSIETTKLSFYYKWCRLYQYNKNLKFLYHQFIDDIYDF